MEQVRARQGWRGAVEGLHRAMGELCRAAEGWRLQGTAGGWGHRAAGSYARLAGGWGTSGQQGARGQRGRLPTTCVKLTAGSLSEPLAL